MDIFPRKTNKHYQIFRCLLAFALLGGLLVASASAMKSEWGELFAGQFFTVRVPADTFPSFAPPSDHQQSILFDKKRGPGGPWVEFYRRVWPPGFTTAQKDQFVREGQMNRPRDQFTSGVVRVQVGQLFGYQCVWHDSQGRSTLSTQLAGQEYYLISAMCPSQEFGRWRALFQAVIHSFRPSQGRPAGAVKQA